MPSEVESPMCTTERHEVRGEAPASVAARLGTGRAEAGLAALAVAVVVVEVEVEVATNATGRRLAGRWRTYAEDAAGGSAPTGKLVGAEVNRAGGLTFARATPANANAITAVPSPTRVRPWRKRRRQPSDLACVHRRARAPWRIGSSTNRQESAASAMLAATWSIARSGCTPRLISGAVSTMIGSCQR